MAAITNIVCFLVSGKILKVSLKEERIDYIRK